MRILLLLALLALVPGWAGAQERFLVGFAQDDMSNDWRAAQLYELEAALEKFPAIDFVFTDAQGSTARNIAQIEQLVNRGIDLLVVSPRDIALMTQVIERVYHQGIPVILLTRRIASENFTSFISPDDQAIARQAAHTLVQAMDYQGRVLILQGVPSATTAIDRTKGFVDALGHYASMEIAAIRVGNYKRADAILAVEQALDEGIAFDGIYAQSDSMAVGARLALRAAGIDPATVPTVGIDYIQEARDAIVEGTQYASFTYPTCGVRAAQIASRILEHGADVPHIIEVPSKRVDRTNVHDVEPLF